MKIILYVSIFLFFFSSHLMGSEYRTNAKEVVQKAKNQCASFESGKFYATEQAISLLDITGDGKPEEFVDGAQFSCSTALTLWGGTGGTYLWVIVDGKKYEFLAHGWQIVDFNGQKVLLLAVHSSECGDKIGPCYRALVWKDEFRTTR